MLHVFIQKENGFFRVLIEAIGSVMNLSLIRSEFFEKSTSYGLRIGLALAQENKQNILLVVPDIKSFKGSSVLREFFGEKCHKHLIKNREIKIIDRNSLMVVLARDSALKRHGGVVVGVWTTPSEANDIVQTALHASDIIITEYGRGELDDWANENRANIIDFDKIKDKSQS